MGDGFGFALAAGDVTGDGRADLAVGVAGENGGEGAVNFLRDPRPGLPAAQPNPGRRTRPAWRASPVAATASAPLW